MQIRQTDELRRRRRSTTFDLYAARRGEPHQRAAPFWPAFRLWSTPDPQTWVPRHVRVTTRPLVQYALYLAVTLDIAIDLKWFGGLGWGPSRVHYLNSAGPNMGMVRPHVSIVMHSVCVGEYGSRSGHCQSAVSEL